MAAIHASCAAPPSRFTSRVTLNDFRSLIYSSKSDQTLLHQMENDGCHKDLGDAANAESTVNSHQLTGLDVRQTGRSRSHAGLDLVVLSTRATCDGPTAM